MPRIFLSPSTQEFNNYVNGGTEEQYMNIIADEMEPYLRASGIQYTRNNRNASTSKAIADSNAGNYDFHLAIHSNAAPENLAGKLSGTDVYYYPYSQNGKRAATIFANNFKEIYPDPSKVRALPSTTIGEVKKTKAPAVLIEVGYHDNPQDANWIKNNTEEIAKNLVVSLTDYFGIPFIEPSGSMQGIVNTRVSPLNIRSKPSVFSSVVAKAPKGATLDIYGQASDDWYVVNYNGAIGYASSKYIKIV